MSNFGTKNVSLNLPEDIEKRLAEVVENISVLEGKIISTTNEVASKELELETLNSKIKDALADYENKIAQNAKITAELNERETKLSNKESALDVYANALNEKEIKINKYLEVFEKMKDVVKKS